MGTRWVLISTCATAKVVSRDSHSLCAPVQPSTGAQCASIVARMDKNKKQTGGDFCIIAAWRRIFSNNFHSFSNVAILLLVGLVLGGVGRVLHALLSHTRREDTRNRSKDGDDIRNFDPPNRYGIVSRDVGNGFGRPGEPGTSMILITGRELGSDGDTTA